MKNSLKYICLFFFLFTLKAQAQSPVRVFSYNTDSTVAEMTRLLESVSKSYKKDADTLQLYFSEQWDLWSSSQRSTFIALGNQMLKKRMKPFPHFKAMIHTCATFWATQPNVTQMQNFEKSVQFFIQNSANKFVDLMERYELIITEKEINSFTSSVHWYARNNMDFQFVFDSIPKIRFPFLDLVGTNGKDSVIIHQTSGDYLPISQRFVGKSGVVDWVRAGLATNEIYVEIQSYQLVLKSPHIVIENVLYYDFRYFDKPQKGQLEDKAITTPKSEEEATYPRFTSYDKNILIKGLYPDVDYMGGVFVRGNRFMGQGTPDNLAKLVFYKEGKEVLRARSTSILLKKGQIESSLCAVSLLVGEDSVYHSAIQLRYNVAKKDLWLIRGKDGSQRMPFFNTYHMLEMYEEAIHWDMNTASLEFTTLPGNMETKLAVFESANFFEEGRTEKFRGMSEINPMYTLYQFFRTNHVREGTLDEIVDYFNYSKDDVRSLMFRFAEGGFVDYNMLTDVISYRQKLGNYLLNENKKKDYDILQFRSEVAGGKPNAVLSFLNNDLTIFGLDMIIVSDSQIVTVFPIGQKITMQKNRDFLFHGKVEAGLFDFWVTNCKFSYDHFNFDFVVIDSMIFYVEDKSLTPNLRGEYPLKQVRSYVEDVNGVLYVDEPNNKSSTIPMPKYPYFESRQQGHVYYDHEYVFNKVYDRNRFYFVVEPFTITHLDDYNTDSLLFNGYLYSDGIFPDLHKSLKVRPDFSLGFIYDTESGGLPAYNGTGNFTGRIDLSNRGLRGTGSVDYLFSHGEGKDMIFFLDSMRAMFDTYVITAQSGGTEYPPLNVKNADVLWLPYQDVMRLENKKAPFIAYDEATLDGVLTVSSRGVRAAGLMKYRNAEMQSDDYQYLHHEMQSNAMSFRLKDTSAEDAYFIQAHNHQGYIDFNKPFGHFTSNTGTEKVELPINQFYTYSKEFDWLVNEEKLVFNYEDPYASVDIPSTPIKELYTMTSEGNELVSMKGSQKGLQFTAIKATYDMHKYEINAEGVRFIEVADAAIFPKNGLVTILKDADIQPLQDAKILANTETQFHEMFHVNARIASKVWYRAEGNYYYVDEEEQKHELFLDSIWVSHDGLTRGRGEIAKEADFSLNPHFGFYGKVNLYAENELLTFRGGINLYHGCDTTQYSAIRYKGEIDPLNVAIPIDSTTHDMNNRRVSAAIASNSKTGKIFTAFARAKNPINSPEYVSAMGVLVYDKEKDAFIVASKERIEDETAGGNIMTLDAQRCVSRGEGVLNLGTKFGRMSFIPVGQVTHYMLQDSTAIGVAASLDFHFNEESMKILSNTIANAGDLPVIDVVENTNYQNALLHLLGASEFHRTYPDLVRSGSFRRLPKALSVSFVFSNLDFEWNQATKAFVTKGDIGIAVCGKKEVDRVVPGMIEIQKKSNQSILQMYFEIGEEWFFFRYYGTSMEGLSSNADFNSAIKNTDAKKRILVAGKGLPAYRYKIGSLGVKKKFLKLHNWELLHPAESESEEE